MANEQQAPNVPDIFPNYDESYSGQGAFRYWCQTVLPITYDDSLSYYELLNKVVNYLNEMLNDINLVETNVGKTISAVRRLHGWCEELKTYVDNYFTNLDVQEEINNKLDSMVSDPTSPLMLTIKDVSEAQATIATEGWLDRHIVQETGYVLDNTLTVRNAAADAKATGDAINNNTAAINNNNIIACNSPVIKDGELSSAYYENISEPDFNVLSTNVTARSMPFECKSGIIIRVNNGYKINVFYYPDRDTAINHVTNYTSKIGFFGYREGAGTFYAPPSDMYFRVTVQKTDGEEITAVEATNNTTIVRTILKEKTNGTIVNNNTLACNSSVPKLSEINSDFYNNISGNDFYEDITSSLNLFATSEANTTMRSTTLKCKNGLIIHVDEGYRINAFYYPNTSTSVQQYTSKLTELEYKAAGTGGSNFYIPPADYVVRINIQRTDGSAFTPTEAIQHIRVIRSTIDEKTVINYNLTNTHEKWFNLNNKSVLNSNNNMCVIETAIPTMQYSSEQHTTAMTTTISVKDGICIPAVEGLKIRVGYYSDGTGTLGTELCIFPAEYTTEDVYVMPYYGIIRIFVKNVDDSAFESLPTISFMRSVNIINKCIDSLSLVNITIDSWEQGSIANTGNNGGNNLDSTTRIRSGGYCFNGCDSVRITVPAGMKLSGREYSAAPTTHDRYIVNTEISGGWVRYALEFKPTHDHVYRFVCAKTDDTDILPNDEIANTTKIVGYNNQLDEMSTTYTSDNSMLGNFSIRAAKTVHYSDGTAPIHEWYLLQDLSNNFYMSKDLKTKILLFNFTPKHGQLKDWFAMIDSDNNVIWTRDAASYNDDLTESDARNTDNNRTTPPVVFLKSENYSVAHSVEFNTSSDRPFYPCSPLANQGYVVMPNKDMIFCEYTRGVFGSCNVWKITHGDPTNQNNWRRVWTHAIIDSVSATEAGMKHCHYIQWDYFYGVAYMGTGDSVDGSRIYYSTDNGNTWLLGYGWDETGSTPTVDYPNYYRLISRAVSLVFTRDHVYWASDNYESGEKGFFIANRDSTTHIIDFNGIEIGEPIVSGGVSYPTQTSSFIPLSEPNVTTRGQACYGCVYLKDLNIIMMMDRVDWVSPANYYPLLLRAYDINSGTIISFPEINGAANNDNPSYPNNKNGLIGFRCKFCDWYPRNNGIIVGFNPMPVNVNSACDTNRLAVCGNLGGRSGNGSTRINNLIMWVYKNVTTDLDFTTNYC